MSRPSETDQRYQRYADIFEAPETHESIERGWRALHWEFSESWNPFGTVTGHADEAREIARRGRETPPARSRTRRSR